MKKSILTMLGVALLATCTSEALSQLPTFSVPPNQTVNNVWCDERPYFLVFQEDFKGRKDPSWLTYVTYKGMVSENDNWGGARAPEIIDENTHQAKMIMLDKNVTLSNDHLILSNYKENAIWRCDTCYSGPFLWSKYTGGMVALPYNNKSLNYGKVEVRAWMSSHNYAHHAVFLWYGVNCNNEVDLIEAFGRQPHLPGNISLRDKTHGSYDTHEWNSEENQCVLIL